VLTVNFSLPFFFSGFFALSLLILFLHLTWPNFAHLRPAPPHRGTKDSWVYTNDAWLNPKAVPYVSGGGSVTRRRRWVRRIWYDPGRVDEEEGGELG